MPPVYNENETERLITKHAIKERLHGNTHKNTQIQKGLQTSLCLVLSLLQRINKRFSLTKATFSSSSGNIQ